MSDGSGVCACCEFGEHLVSCEHPRGRPPDRDAFPELAGNAEVARIFGISTARLWVISQDPKFPKPVARLRCGAIYLAEEIRAYDAIRSKKPGRPIKTSPS